MGLIIMNRYCNEKEGSGKSRTPLSVIILHK